MPATDPSSTPAVVQHRISTRRGQLAALSARPASGAARDATVLLVPGLTGGKEDFAEVLPHLAADGWPALAIDLFGQQESDGTDDPADYSLAELAADLTDVIADIAGPVHLVGHSFGGLVVQHALTTRTATGDLEAAAVVLLDSGPGALPPGRRRDLTQALADSAMDLTAEQAWDLVVQVRTVEGAWPPPDEATANFQRQRWITTRPAHHAGCASALLTAAEYTGALAASGTPVAVMYGVDEDAWPAPLQQEMAERLGVTAIALPNAAHSPAAENPAATAAALVSFLRGVAG